MTSSGSRPPDSSHTSHRFTRCRVTSKFGFARLIPLRSSMNAGAALYRGPPIASQSSWNETRYAVGWRAWPSQRTLVTVATRTGKSSRIFRSISGSVWIGRIGMLSASFGFGGDSGAQMPCFSRSHCARWSAVSKKIGRPSWPHAWQTYERLSLSIPAIGPIMRSFGCTRPLPHRAHAAKSLGWKAAIERLLVYADDLHTLSDPVGRQIHATRGAALRDHLLDHLLTEDFELRILPRTCHVPLPDEDEDDAGT